MNNIVHCNYLPVVQNSVIELLSHVTEFWKITHMGMREIIRIFMSSVLLIRAGHRFENISRIFL